MTSRIEQALQEMPKVVSDFLAPIFLNRDFDATLSTEQFAELQTITGLADDELRLALLPLAAALAYTPLSKFNVGALARGTSGKIYFGANIEFDGVQLGQTIHAEQCAISHAWMKGETGIKDVTVNYSPCGHCRQFMNELTTSQTLQIQLPERAPMSLQEYLPDSFGPGDLGIDAGLMSSVNHELTSQDSDPLIQHALSALNRSHAPYTHNLSGVALKLKNGRIFTGAYAENAAFNPSLPPLQVALAQLLIAQQSIDDIEAGALVEMSSGTISHLACTQSTLEAINPDATLAYLSL
ncbi:cytidine deaminase [Vibrio olivae]|uniref:Cytidine deaminase n=1 Tax=Vibrio olivae TaxID=1243002 RepID=A0ABV5HJ93_9VIBR